jgi:hypothetical protein
MDRNADSNCVPIRHPAYVKPDPLIYSQSYLMSLGLPVTWDNPDIEVRRSGVPVPSSDIQTDTDYELVARIWNGSSVAPIIGLVVEFSFLDFGMGAIPIPIAETSIVLGVKGSAGCPAFASVPWRSPSTPGHYCIQVKFDWIDDSNPLNNLGQENLQVSHANSPAEFAFVLRNDSPNVHTFVFEVDTYELPEPGPCPTPTDRVDERTPRPERTTLPNVPAATRERHALAGTGIPDGWSVRFDPEQPRLNPQDSIDVSVSIAPPLNFAGTKRFNARGIDGDFIAGGVTLTVVAP